jgi:hypothetical protein
MEYPQFETLISRAGCSLSNLFADDGWQESVNPHSILPCQLEQMLVEVHHGFAQRNQGGKQDRAGMGRENRPSRGRRTGPVPASPECRVGRGDNPRTNGHNFTDQVSAGQPSTCHSLDSIEPLLTLDGAGPLFRMDPMSCSARFRDGAGCDRSRGDR